MTINSRLKGANGEREFAEVLRSAGFSEARRDGQQGSGGSAEDPDVCGLSGWHVEVKRVEIGGAKAYEWLSQSVRDAGTSGLRPFVAHRRNRSDWIIILRVQDFLEVLKTVEAYREVMGAIIHGTRKDLEEPDSWVPPYVARSQEGKSILPRIDLPPAVRGSEAERARQEQDRQRDIDDLFYQF